MKFNATLFLVAIAVVLNGGCRSMPTWNWWQARRSDPADSTPIARSAPELPSQIAARTEGDTAPPFTSGVQITIPETPEEGSQPYASTGYPSTSIAGIGSLVPPKLAVNTPVANADITTGSDGTQPNVSITPASSVAAGSAPYSTKPPLGGTSSVAPPTAPVQLNPNAMPALPQRESLVGNTRPAATNSLTSSPATSFSDNPLPRVSLPPLSPPIAATSNVVAPANPGYSAVSAPSVSIPPPTRPSVGFPQATLPQASLPPTSIARAAVTTPDNASEVSGNASPGAAAAVATTATASSLGEQRVASTAGLPYRPGGTGDYEGSVSVATRPGGVNLNPPQIPQNSSPSTRY